MVSPKSCANPSSHAHTHTSHAYNGHGAILLWITLVNWLFVANDRKTNLSPIEKKSEHTFSETQEAHMRDLL